MRVVNYKDRTAYFQYVNYITARQGRLAIEEAIKHLTKYTEESTAGKEDTNPFIPDKMKTKVLKAIRKTIISSLKVSNPDLLEFEEKCFSKWVGFQGGTPSIDEVDANIRAYYDNIVYEKSFPAFDERVYSDFYNCCHFESFQIPRNKWNWIHPDHKSNSGLTTWSDRRDLNVRRKAIIQSSLYKELDPIVIGTRCQRRKIRNIHMDSFANYYREWPYYAYIMNTLKDSNYVAWRGDDKVEEFISDFIDKCDGNVTFFESDYESMDTWVCKEHADLVHSIYSKLDPHYPFDLLDVREFHRELFNVTLLGPNNVYQGEHALLSGIFPTNPLETPLNLWIQLHFIQFLRELLNREFILGVDFILVVLGDDVIILFKGNDIPPLSDLFANFVWETYRIKANPSKQRQSTTSGFFCKRQYAIKGTRVTRKVNGKDRQVRVSIYPIALVLNNIFWPEQHASKYGKKDRFIQVCQRCDNAMYHPFYKILLGFMYDLHPEFHNMELNQGDIQEYNQTHYDWRRSLGDEYQISKSPTYLYFISRATK